MSKQGYTQFPHDFYSILPTLSEKELKVLLYVLHHTKGKRQQPNTSATVRAVMAETGLGRSSVIQALAMLEEKKVIHRAKAQVSVNSPEFKPRVQNLDLNSPDFKPKVQILNHDSSLNQQPLFYKNMFKHDDDDSISADFELLLPGLVKLGFDEQSARQICLTAVANRREATYLTNAMGYVAQVAKTNPAGLLVTIVSKNQDIPALEAPAAGPGRSSTARKRKDPMDERKEKWKKALGEG